MRRYTFKLLGILLIFLGIKDVQAQMVAHQDSLALVALFESTSGENWENNSNWLTADIKEWYGIEVDDEGRITRIILGDNNLVGIIPAELSDLTMLERLELDGNNLSGEIPDLTGLVNLERLQLGGTNLSGSFPHWVVELGKLEDLRLWDVDFESGPIPDLSSLLFLKDIRLTNTNRTGEIPAWLGELIYLERLDLDDNELSGEIPQELKKLGSLERLTLTNNKLTGPIHSWLAELGNLQRLELDDNQLTGVLPGVITQFAKLSKLETLELSNNHITGLAPPWLDDLGEFNKLKLKEPVGLFLTWQRDPTSTMTIDWHTTPEDKAEPTLRYKKVGSANWIEMEASSHEFPHSDREINRVELTNLEPSTYYRFQVGEFERLYKFRTMPEDLNQPLRFATGGDTSHEQHLMSATAMQYDLDFIVWGGDYAYSDGDPIWLYRWYGWFDGIRENLISEEGRVVPIVLAIGNHEIFTKRNLLRGRNVHHEHTVEEAREYMEKHNLWDRKVTFFFDLFAFPGEPAYGVLDFSDYMSLVILDSGINSDIGGEQAEWLANVLRERQTRPHIFPVYHMPAYPTFRTFETGDAPKIREHWVPHFENYGVRVAFENHDHAYKRTHPIREGKIDDTGIVYIGDGNWARSPRRGSNRDAWYIKEFASVRHGIIVTLQGTQQHYLMVDEHGNIIDEYINE